MGKMGVGKARRARQARQAKIGGRVEKYNRGWHRLQVAHAVATCNQSEWGAREARCGRRICLSIECGTVGKQRHGVGKTHVGCI